MYSVISCCWYCFTIIMMSLMASFLFASRGRAIKSRARKIFESITRALCCARHLLYFKFIFYFPSSSSLMKSSIILIQELTSFITSLLQKCTGIHPFCCNNVSFLISLLIFSSIFSIQ